MLRDCGTAGLRPTRRCVAVWRRRLGQCRLLSPPRRPMALRDPGMETVLRSLSVLALLAVVGVLLAGLWNMLRGKNPNLSQTLMRWRVGLQFLAIVVAMLLVYLLR